jgi:hypothetical protein
MTEQGDLIRHQPHLKERASNEFKRSIHKSFILSQHHLDYREHAFAFINAFVFAKVLLFAEDFNLGTRFRDKPLIYPVLHKCFLFTLVVVGFHITNVALVGLWHGG